MPINIQDVNEVKLILGCQLNSFPVVYLGMLLDTKSPKKEDLMPLIEKIERRLDGWNGKLLSRVGRLLLANSFLASIPIYFMGCFMLPYWAILRIDRIRRQFLWGKTVGDTKGISLVNWNVVCLPKKWGRLGVPDSQLRNIALLLRWWWRLYSNPEALWTQAWGAGFAIESQISDS